MGIRGKQRKMYEDRVLAYIDILGFSEAIKKTIKEDGTESLLETQKIDNFFDKAQEELNKYYPSGDTFINSKVARNFSDSIVISYLITEESGIFHLLAEVLFFCTTALQKGFLFRGAIVHDKLYHKENKIFGPAMIKATNLEKNLAIYPRIIFDDEILEIAEKYPAKYPTKCPSKKEQIRVIKKLISKDFDGLNYINYIDGINYIVGEEHGILVHFEKLRTVIINLGKDIDKSISIKSKYLWIKEKYNTVLAEYKKKYSKNKMRTESPKLCDYLENIALL
jgi:hypothetical protein